MGWLGGNSKPVQFSNPPVVSYVVRLRHTGLRLGAYTEYQTALSNEILRLRDAEKMTFKDIARLLISKGWKSPRGLSLGPESVFSIYKKRKARDKRLTMCPKLLISHISIDQKALGLLGFQHF